MRRVRRLSNSDCCTFQNSQPRRGREAKVSLRSERAPMRAPDRSTIRNCRRFQRAPRRPRPWRRCRTWRSGHRLRAPTSRRGRCWSGLPAAAAAAAPRAVAVEIVVAIGADIRRQHGGGRPQHRIGQLDAAAGAAAGREVRARLQGAEAVGVGVLMLPQGVDTRRRLDQQAKGVVGAGQAAVNSQRVPLNDPAAIPAVPLYPMPE